MDDLTAAIKTAEKYVAGEHPYGSGIAYATVRVLITAASASQEAAAEHMAAERLLLDRIDALKAERDALRKDAERYRWLRDNERFNWAAKWYLLDAHKFDAAVDAAIAASAADKEGKS